jgi:hypothetical protein
MADRGVTPKTFFHYEDKGKDSKENTACNCIQFRAVNFSKFKCQGLVTFAV